MSGFRILCHNKYLLLNLLFAIQSGKLNAQRSYYGTGSFLPLREEISIHGSDIILLPAGILLRITDCRINSVVADHLGSAKVQVDNSIIAMAAFDYSPFGSPIQGAAFDACSVLFAGTYLWEPGLNLYRTPTRKYDPMIKRFTSIDPGQQSPAAYDYVAANPIRYIDPDGQIIRIAGGDHTLTHQSQEYIYQAERMMTPELPEFVQQTYAVLDHLAATDALNINFGTRESPEQIPVLEELINKPGYRLLIRKGTDNVYSARDRRISFNPEQGIRFKRDISKALTKNNTGYNSAASALAHELLHAYHEQSDLKSFISRKRQELDESVFPYFPNEEERRVTVLTNQVNLKLGEEERIHYKAEFYPILHPLTTERKPASGFIRRIANSLSFFSR